MRMRESFSKPRGKSAVLRNIKTGIDEYEESKSGEGNDMREYLRGLSMFSEYADLLKMLDEEPGISDQNTEQLQTEAGTLKRLADLAYKPLADSVEYLLYSASQSGSDFLTGRLERYRDLLEKGTRTHEGIKRGLLRDLTYAAMQGTPEMGALKIAHNRLKAEGGESKGNRVAELFGYYSGIEKYNHGDSRQGVRLGVYPHLIKMYENAKQQVELSIKKFDLPTPREEIEHKAVLKAAGQLVEINKEYGRIHYGGSPWNNRQSEAFAWVQLGDGIKGRMSRMRAKMPDHALNFKNIGRFIGKSGDNKYTGEHKRLYGQIKFLKGASDVDKKSFVERENHFAIDKMTRWYEKEVEKLRQRAAKSEVPDPPLTELEQEFKSRLSYLQNRSLEQLLNDLEQRQHVVAQRYEKRKSLADKAFDLHFHFNHPKNRQEKLEEAQNNKIEAARDDLAGALNRTKEFEVQLKKDFPEFQNLVNSTEANLEGQARLSKAHQLYAVRLEQELDAEYQARKERLESRLQTREHNLNQSGAAITPELLREAELEKIERWYGEQREELSSNASNGVRVFLEHRDDLHNLQGEVSAKKDALSRITAEDISDSGAKFTDMIDYINEAPFGTIKRAHAMMRKGVSDENILKLAFADMYGDKKQGLTREALDNRVFLDHIIAAGRIDYLFRYRSEFGSITETEIADKLLESGKIEIDGYMNKFTNLDASFADRLMAAGKGLLIPQNPSRFNNLDQERILNTLIETTNGEQNKYHLLGCLGNFSSVNHADVARKLIARGTISNVEEYFPIQYTDHHGTAQTLIKAGAITSFDDYLAKFNCDRSKIADALLESGQTYWLAHHLQFYQQNGLDASVARTLMDRGQIEQVLYHLPVFTGLNHAEIADKILTAKQYDIFFRNVKKFAGMDCTDVALRLISDGKGPDVGRSMSNFRNIDHNAVAQAMIEAGILDTVVQNITGFKNLAAPLAIQLIATGQSYSVLSSPGSFGKIDQQEIIDKAIQHKNYREVAQYIGNFPQLNHSEIVIDLINAGGGFAVAGNMQNFKGVNHAHTAEILIQSGAGDILAQNLYHFENIDYEVVADQLIKNGRSASVAANLQNFKELNQNRLAKRFIEEGNAKVVSDYVRNFSGLDSSVATALEVQLVAGNLSCFRDLEPSIVYEIIKAGKGLNILRSTGSFASLDAQMIEKLVTKAEQHEIVGAKQSLFDYFVAHTDVAIELMQSGKDDAAYKIGSVGVILDDATLSQLPEHVSVAYKIGYASSVAIDTGDGSTPGIPRDKTLTAIKPERSPITIRSILRGLEGKKLGKNFRESIEYLFNTADPEAREMIDGIIRSDHLSAPRIVRTLVQIDASKGTKYAIDLIRRSGAPDRLFAYFVHLLAKSGGITKNAPEFLKTAENMPVIRRMVAENPNQLNTTLDTCKALGINNLQSEGEVVFSALQDLSSLTPKIYKTYKSLNGAERKGFVDWINAQKEGLFENTRIDFGATEAANTPGGFVQDRDVIIEMIHQAYNPVGMSFENVKDLLTRIDDRTADLSNYTFPQKGYPVQFSDVSYRLRKDETLNAEWLAKTSQMMLHRDIESMTTEQREAFNKVRDAAFTKLAKGETTILERISEEEKSEKKKPATGFSEEEINALFQAVATQEPIGKLVGDIAAKKGAYDYPLLNRMYEAFGVYAKDNVPGFLAKYIQNNPDLDKLIKELPKSQIRRRELLKKLGIVSKDPKVEDPETAEVPDTVLMGRLFAEKILEKQRSLIKKEIKKFQRDAGSEGEAAGEFRVYISKNKGSFFAKAAAGICTAQDVTLWNMKNHFHINVVDDRQTVQGNIQGYFETVNGKPALVLRGFNPTETLLKRVAPDSYMKNIIRISKEFATANKIDSVYITEALGGWHADSNRTQIREYIPKNIYSKVAPVSHHMKISGNRSVDKIYVL